MALYENKNVRLAANAATPEHYIRLNAGQYRVDIEYAQGTTGTVTPKQTVNPSNTSALHDCRENGAAISVTGSYSFIIVGPVWIGCVIASLSGGGSINLSANRIDD